MLKAVCAALAACVMAPALYAAAPADPLTKSSAVLKLDGLNLATTQGQRTLSIRMNQVARDVCGKQVATIHLALEAQSRLCQDEVKADIRSRIERRVADAGSVMPDAFKLAVQSPRDTSQPSE